MNASCVLLCVSRSLREETSSQREKKPPVHVHISFYNTIGFLSVSNKVRHVLVRSFQLPEKRDRTRIPLAAS
jgi:hypothetical protein